MCFIECEVMIKCKSTLPSALQIMQMLDEERITGQMCDVVFIVDGERFPCHSVVLTSANPHFYTLIGENFNVANYTTEIPLNGMDKEAFGLTLDYIYRGHIQIDMTNFHQLMHLATTSKFVNILHIYVKCTKYLKESINVMRACTMALYFTEHPDEKLLKFSTSLLKKKITEAYLLDEFLKLPYPVMKVVLQKVARGGKKVGSGERKAVDTINRWMLYNLEERDKYRADLEEIFPFLTPKTVPPADIKSEE